jgi:hypothetical protein
LSVVSFQWERGREGCHPGGDPIPFLLIGTTKDLREEGLVLGVGREGEVKNQKAKFKFKSE